MSFLEKSDHKYVRKSSPWDDFQCLKSSLLTALIFSFMSMPAAAKDYLVDSQKDYQKALKKIKPGDAIVLKDGEWEDFQIIFEGKGKKDAKLTLRAETPGGVVLTGQSNLRMGGIFLDVSGLVFKNGYAPGRYVIDMRSPKFKATALSELNNILIDGYSKPGTDDKDYWINFRGLQNRLTDSALLNKTSLGATVIASQREDATRPGQHIIDKNYFGPRSPLSKNGGETIRIGAGKVAHQRFEMRIVNNYFERCNGEAENISIKSGGNIIRNNMFVETGGAITFRHGDDNLVERNMFFGNGVKGTGGVRLTSFDQIVRDNYFEGLRGKEGRSALTFMNGFSDTLPVHYRQVQNALIANNSFIDVETLTFGLESDKDGDWPPLGSLLTKNIFAAPNEAQDINLSIDTDMTGLSFENNVGNVTGLKEINFTQDKSLQVERGLNGLYYLSNKAELTDMGAPHDLTPFARNDVGPVYFNGPNQ